MNFKIEQNLAHLVRVLVMPLPVFVQTRVARLFFDCNSPTTLGFNATVSFGHGLRFTLYTKDQIGWRIFFTGCYERESNFVLSHLCRPSMTVIEAGANNGSETLLIADWVREGGGRVFAFEPVPHVRRQLEHNISLNELGSIISVQSEALAEDEGAAVFHLLPRHDPNQGMSSRFVYPESREQLAVTKITLDHWMEQHQVEELDLLKMDIQGGELGLLEGGEQTIDRFRPMIYLEATRIEQAQAGRSMEELGAYFFKRGYRLWAFRPNRLQPIPMHTCRELKEGNWLAVDQRRLNVLTPGFRRKLGC